MARSDSTPLDWSPRHAWAWAALACLVCTMLLAWPALGGGFLVNPHSDQYIAGYPFRQFAAEHLRSGLGFPQWNPYLQGGMPYVAAMHGDIFYPTFLLRLLLPTDVAMTWGFVLHILLAGVATIGFLRSTGFGFLPAVIGGIGYMLSGQLASFPSPGHDGKLFVSALLPLTLWMIVRGVRDGARWSWGVLALVVGLGVLSPHPQLLQYLLLTAGAFALFLTLWPSLVGPSRTSTGRTASGASDATIRAAASGANATDASSARPFGRLALALGAIAIGFAIGAAQFLPVAEYVDWSPRSGGKGFDYATSFSMPLEETINMWLPQFSGILDNYWGANGIHFHSEYLGVAVLLLAAAGLTGGARAGTRGHALFWLGTTIVTLLWAWGGNTPFYQIVYALVPGTKFFRAPSTILYVVSFSTAMLAAFGAERMLAGRLGSRFVIGAVAAGGITALFGVLGVWTSLAEAVMVDPSLVVRVDANASAVLMGSLRVALVACATAGIAWAMGQRRLPLPAAGALLAAVVALDLWSVGRQYWLFSDRADTLYASDAAIDAIKADGQPGRVLALGFQGGGEMARRDPFLGGSALMAQEVRDVMGYHGNELGRYRRLIEATGNSGITGNPNFWALTNSRFLYTNLDQVPFDESRQLAGPVRNAAGSMVYLYTLPGENPYAWVVPLRVKADDEATLATVLDPRFDLRRAALFAPEATVDAPNADQVGALPGPLDSVTARVVRYAPGDVEIALDGSVPTGAALVVSENFYPGWRAEVDGQPVTVERANFVLAGIPLPAGAQRVQLRFENDRNRQGQLITLLAVLAAGAWALAGLVLERRSLRD
jgi:hypothetical protein